MKRLLYFVSIALTFLLVLGGIIAFLFFRKDIQEKFFTPKVTQQPGAIAPNEPIAKCTTGDEKCQSRNERIKANKLQGQSAAYTRHQCDGPRACPTPNPEQEAAAQDAIRSFAKDTKMELLRMNGINAAGLLYYCSQDNSCWSYDTKTKKVTVLKEETKESTPSPIKK